MLPQFSEVAVMSTELRRYLQLLYVLGGVSPVLAAYYFQNDRCKFVTYEEDPFTFIPGEPGMLKQLAYPTWGVGVALHPVEDGRKTKQDIQTSMIPILGCTLIGPQTNGNYERFYMLPPSLQAEADVAEATPAKLRTDFQSFWVNSRQLWRKRYRRRSA